MQVWLIVGVPALLVAVMLLISASQVANLLGYLVLGIGFVVITSVDRLSGAIFGALLPLVYATGRGHTRPSAGPDVMPDAVHDQGHGHVAAGEASGRT